MPRTRLLAAAAALGAAALLGGCAATPSTPPTDGGSATAGVTLNAGQLGAAKLTEEMLTASGESDGMDYTVDWSLFEAGPQLMEAIPSGQVDVGLIADTPMIFAQAAGLPVSIVAVAHTSAPGESFVQIVAMPDSGITSMADLEGKSVAMAQGTILQYTAIAALEDAGLSYDDIEPVYLSPADSFTALTEGDVDAAALIDPQFAISQQQGSVVVGDGVGLVTDVQVTIATDDALGDPGKAAAIEDLILRIDRAQQWALANPEEWAAAYAAAYSMDEALAQAIIARQGYDLVPIDDEAIAAQQAQADVFAELGLLQAPLDVADEFDDRFNDAVEAAE